MDLWSFFGEFVASPIGHPTYTLADIRALSSCTSTNPKKVSPRTLNPETLMPEQRVRV